MNTVWRVIYQPYKWLILIPVFTISTLFFAGMTVALCFVLSPGTTSWLCGTAWARLNAWLTPMWVSIQGREHIDPHQSYVIVSNHQSQYDIFVLYGFLGIDFKWVMKKELRKAPMLGLACERLGHIYIDRSDHKAAVASINSAKERIRNGTSVIFFPEGTRSRSGDLLPFKKGAFKMARDLGLPVLPVAIIGTRDILPPDTLDILPGRARMVIHKPVPVEEYRDIPVTSLMEKVQGEIQHTLNHYQHEEVPPRQEV